MPIRFINSLGGVADATTPLQFTPTNAGIAGNPKIFCSVGPGSHDSVDANFSDPGSNAYVVQVNAASGTLVTDERAIIASSPGTTGFAASGNMGQVFSGAGTAIISMAFEVSGCESTAEVTDSAVGTGDDISGSITNLTDRALLVACVGKHRGTSPAWDDGHGWTAVQADIVDATAAFNMRLFYKIVSIVDEYTWADSSPGASEDWVIALASFPIRSPSSSGPLEKAAMANLIPITFGG